MAPIRETHPHPIWDLGEYLDDLFKKASVNPVFGAFFDLMPQVDLDEIRRVGHDVWGHDFERMGAVTGTMNKVATELPHIVDRVGAGWSGPAFDRFSEHMAIDQSFFERARGISENAGQALITFADACDANLSDGLAVLVGIVGGVVGAVIGIFGGPGGVAAGAIVGAVVGFAVGLLFTYIGTLLPKMVGAYQALNDLADQLPPDYAA